MERYFRDLMRDAEAHALDRARPSVVVEETTRREGLPGGGLARAIGDPIDRAAGVVLEDVVSTLVGGVTDSQATIVLACADECGSACEAHEDEFVEGLAPLLSDLNPAARTAFASSLREGFGPLVESAAYFAALEGDTFARRVRSGGRDRAAAALDDAVEYVTVVRRGLDRPAAVHVEADPPVPGVGPLRIHLQREAVRLLDDVEGFLRERTRRTVERAYADGG